MRHRQKLACVSADALDGFLQYVPSLPNAIRRSRWVIARCALFVGFAAVGLAFLLLQLAPRGAVAG